MFSLLDVRFVLWFLRITCAKNNRLFFFYQNTISYYPKINEVRKHDDMDKGTDLSQLSRSLKGIPAPCVSGLLQAQG